MKKWVKITIISTGTLMFAGTALYFIRKKIKANQNVEKQIKNVEKQIKKTNPVVSSSIVTSSRVATVSRYPTNPAI